MICNEYPTLLGVGGGGGEADIFLKINFKIFIIYICIIYFLF
jgi:hypothetical protein